MNRRTKGFTLIELLVVIAIIGILASMVFPVFARARESARKAVCLSNMKNIALAINMYLADNNDTFWPYDHDWDALTALYRYWGDVPTENDYCTTNGNPFMRPPVILDEYVKNRDVWRCPSSKVEISSGFIVPIGRRGFWYNSYVDYGFDQYGVTWGRAEGIRTGPCRDKAWPPGWGGDITDSFLQGPTHGGNYTIQGGNIKSKAFTYSIAVIDADDEYGGPWGLPYNPLRGRKMSAFEDVAHTVVATEVYMQTNQWPLVNHMMYPDVCGALDWGDGYVCLYDPVADHVFTEEEQKAFAGGGPLSKNYTRHLGGSNFAFMDGHAAWMAAGTIRQQFLDGELEGVCGYCPAP